MPQSLFSPAPVVKNVRALTDAALDQTERVRRPGHD